MAESRGRAGPREGGEPGMQRVRLQTHSVGRGAEALAVAGLTRVGGCPVRQRRWQRELGWNPDSASQYATFELVFIALEASVF